jgi:hypothetical protein
LLLLILARNERRLTVHEEADLATAAEGDLARDEPGIGHPDPRCAGEGLHRGGSEAKAGGLLVGGAGLAPARPLRCSPL